MLLLLSVLFLGSVVFGAVDYSRDPSGFTIENPVSFDVSFDDFSELCDASWNWWSIYFLSEIEEPALEIFSEDLIASTTKNYIFVENLPLVIYTEVKPACCAIIDEDLECEDTDPVFEYNPAGIFEVVEPPPPTLYAFTTADLASTTAYISDIFTSIRSLFFLAGGIHLAFYVIKRVIRIFPM